jgi:hypothetical protein
MSGRGGDVPPGPSAAAVVGRLRALGGALAKAKRRMAEGTEVDLTPLHRSVVEALGPLPGGAATGSGVGAGLLLLLDEATALVARLELESESLRERGQAWVRRRRADVSYVAVGRRR